jgi:predicted nuclease of predicted toxin-antitoxin system
LRETQARREHPAVSGDETAALGFDVDTVLDERLGGRSDEAVWAAAQAEDRFLVTHDLDSRMRGSSSLANTLRVAAAALECRQARHSDD